MTEATAELHADRQRRAVDVELRNGERHRRTPREVPHARPRREARLRREVRGRVRVVAQRVGTDGRLCERRRDDDVEVLPRVPDGPHEPLVSDDRVGVLDARDATAVLPQPAREGSEHALGLGRHGDLQGHDRPQRGERVPRLGGERHGRLDDVVAERREVVRRPLRRRDARRVDDGVGRDERRRQQPDAQPTRARVERREEAARRATRLDHVARPRVREDVEERSRVPDIAREDPVARETRPVRAPRTRTHEPAARLEPDEPARARGDADRPAAVVAVGDRDDAGRDRGGRSAARAAGRARRVPRRAGRGSVVGLGVAGQAELGRRRLAEHHRARTSEERDDAVVDVRDVVREERGPRREAHARDHREVLDGARDAEQRWEAARVVGGREDPLGLRGLGERPLGREGDERADLRAETLGAVERMAHDLGRGGLAAADRLCGLEGREVVKLAHAPSLGPVCARSSARVRPPYSSPTKDTAVVWL